MGVVQLTGLRKEVAEFYGLGNQPAVQIGDVIKNTPAEKAGLKAGWIIVKMNGQPLERGDEPEELPQILRRKVLRMKVGSQVTFQILEEPNKPLKDVTLTLDEQPKRPNLAQRWYDDRLGLGVREIVFSDTYRAKLPADQKGVVVSVVKPSSSAETARVKMNDIVTQMNGKPVEDLEQFKTDFQQFRKEKPREAVILEVTRDGNTQVIRIEPPQ
jgi:serine protease Do